MEYLDVVDEKGNPTGEVVERTQAHRSGLRHRTSHVWIVRKHEGRIQLLLQRRCKDKDSFPECYDISSAGHIPAGYGFVESALRELEEELSLSIKEEELQDCGLITIDIASRFHEAPFVDKQIAKVFLLWKDIDEKDIVVQKEEIDCVIWMDFEAVRDGVRNNTFPNCIVLEELDILEKHF